MILYGTDAYVAVDAASEVAAGSVSGATSVTIDWLTLEPYTAYDVEAYETPAGYNHARNVTVQTYHISVFGFDVNDAGEFGAFEDLQAVLKKKFLYLDASDYYHTVHTAGKVIGVQLSEPPAISSSPPYIDVDFSLIKMRS